MTRHDPPVQTAATHRRSTKWFAPGATATIIMHANLSNTVAAEAQRLPGRRSAGRRATPYAAARSRTSVTPNQKTP